MLQDAVIWGNDNISSATKNKEILYFEDMIQNGVGRIGGERRAKEGLRNTLFEKYS